MQKTSKTIVFFGNEQLATGTTTETPAFKALLDADYRIAALVINQRSVITGRTKKQLTVEQIALTNNIPVLAPTKTIEVVDQLKSFKAEVGVLAAYGRIVPQAIIDIFPKGIINIHPSLLPLHRGPTPIESVILDGSPKTGVSIMQLVKAMDAGPLFSQSEVALTGQESKQELADELGRLGSKMLIDVLPKILDGKAKPEPQDDTRATYDNMLTVDMGYINWNKPAKQLAREVRAYLNWPKSRTKLAGKDTIILDASAQPSQPGLDPGEIAVTDKTTLLVQTSHGALNLHRLQPAGKPAMTTQQYLAGYSNHLK